ncbi:MAG TPA: hypothetical protein VKB76_05300, partial [Ktedonobacterales bacterium]|nr:hypothetical protein [Ktedonobacterales bacterium]
MPVDDDPKLLFKHPSAQLGDFYGARLSIANDVLILKHEVCDGRTQCAGDMRLAFAPIHALR